MMQLRQRQYELREISQPIDKKDSITINIIVLLESYHTAVLPVFSIVCCAPTGVPVAWALLVGCREQPFPQLSWNSHSYL